MIVEAAALIAGAVLLLTGAVVWAAIRYTTSFGAYTVATDRQTAKQDQVLTLLMTIHESNQLLAGQNARMLEALKRAHTNGKEDAA